MVWWSSKSTTVKTQYTHPHGVSSCWLTGDTESSGFKILTSKQELNTLLRHLINMYYRVLTVVYVFDMSQCVYQECFVLEFVRKTICPPLLTTLTLNMSFISPSKPIRELHLYMKKICFIYLKNIIDVHYGMYCPFFKKNIWITFNILGLGTKTSSFPELRSHVDGVLRVCMREGMRVFYTTEGLLSSLFPWSVSHGSIFILLRKAPYKHPKVITYILILSFWGNNILPEYSITRL